MSAIAIQYPGRVGGRGKYVIRKKENQNSRKQAEARKRESYRKGRASRALAPVLGIPLQPLHSQKPRLHMATEGVWWRKKKRPRKTYSLFLFLPSSFHPSLLPSSPSMCCASITCCSLDTKDTTMNKNSESPPIPEVITGKAVLVSRCFWTGRDWCGPWCSLHESLLGC